MPESGEWFSPRTRPEMLTSDDPPIPNDKPPLVRILPGPATAMGRATAPLRRLLDFVPSIGRRIVRVDDAPSRWQLVGMWTSGSAIVAGTGLAVAAALGGAPAGLTQPFEQLSVLPGIIGEQSQPDAVSSSSDGKPAADRAAADGSRRSSGHSSGYSGGSSGAVPGAVVDYPEDLVPGRAAVPGVSSAGASSTGGTSAGGQTTVSPVQPSAGAGTTTPVTDPTTEPTTEPTTAAPTAAPTTEPTTEPPVAEPTQEPTDPGTPPTEDPTDPAPTVDPTPAPTPEDPPTDPTQDLPTDSPPAPTPRPRAAPDRAPPPTARHPRPRATPDRAPPPTTRGTTGVGSVPRRREWVSR